MSDTATLYQVLASAEKHVQEIKDMIAARKPNATLFERNNEEYRNADTNGNY